MACSVPRQVGATYQALWTKVKANAAARAAGTTKRRYQGLDQRPKYVSPTVMYQLGHDYGFKTGQQVSIQTLEGRVILSYTAMLATWNSSSRARVWARRRSGTTSPASNSTCW